MSCSTSPPLTIISAIGRLSVCADVLESLKLTDDHDEGKSVVDRRTSEHTPWKDPRCVNELLSKMDCPVVSALS